MPLMAGLDISLTAKQWTHHTLLHLRRDDDPQEPGQLCRAGVQIMIFLCFAPGIYLFRVILYSKQGLVFSLRNMGHLGSKYHFSTLLEERALVLFTLL